MVFGRYVFPIMSWYALTMNNYGTVQEDSNDGVDWVSPQFQAIKGTSVAFNINKILQGWVGKLKIFKVLMR